MKPSFFLFLFAFVASAQAQEVNWRQAVGFETAMARLKPDVPLGRGVTVGYVEGNAAEYPPNAQDPRLAGIDILLRSGEGLGSAHATHGASIAFGSGGIAPGVRALHAFNVPNWLTDGYLRARTQEPPADDGLRLFNHSWISPAAAGAAPVLRRVDWVIEERDVVMCVGVNNGRDTPVPAMLSSAYNVIAVGTAKDGGNSSGGYTRVEGEGRCKPDLVGPQDLTSYATAAVTACCAILMERAAGMEDARALRAQTIKAALLAGAVKPEFWRRSEGKPLDEHLGAGIVNVDRALQVLDGGPADGRQILRAAGWSFVELGPGATRSFQFETARVWRELTVVAVWHRRIDGRTITAEGMQHGVWLDAPRLANVDLMLTHYDERGAASELAASRSTIDNVEHVYRGVVTPGRYRIDVARQADGLDETWEVALAWWMREAEDQAWASPEQGTAASE